MNNLKIDINLIPQEPGVYLWKDSKEQILYIGKAKNIRNRIKQYLNGTINSYKTKKMLANASDISYIICINEKESLILEQELIKKHRPYYNILFLDDKKYPFIVVELKSDKLKISTKFDFREEKNRINYGPLPVGSGSKIIKNLLIRECLYNNGFPIVTKDYEIWKSKFNLAKEILKSSNVEFVKKLKSQMQNASDNLQFELAKEIRDQINTLENNNHDNQAILINSKKENFDVIAFVELEDYLLITIHYFKNGNFFMQENLVIEINIDLMETITNFINQFYTNRNKPKFLITNYKINNDDLLFDMNILNPMKGILKQTLENAINNTKLNAQQKILEHKNKIQKQQKAKLFIEKISNKIINNILIIDNSNTNNTDIVSAIIYYKNYIKCPSNYRKYSLKKESLNRLSDVEYIKEGLNNYFSKKTNEIPDLIIVDGGKAQINEAKKIIEKYSLHINVFGLVKNEKHQTDFLLDDFFQRHNFVDNDVYNFFANIQDEVDKYAKKYHYKKRIQSSLEGFLLSIDGVGPKTEKKILDHFKTYSKIFNSTEKELTKVVSQNIAKKIINEINKIK